MHVCIYRDSQLPECQSDHDIRRLSPNAGQFKKLLETRRNLATKARQELVADSVDCLGLDVVERHRIDRRLDGGNRRGPHRPRRTRNGKQSFARRIRRSILSSETQQAGDQDREWSLDVITDGRYWPLPSLPA